MTNTVPLPAKILGGLGLIPVIMGVVAGFSGNANQFLETTFNTHGGRLLVTYTTIIFCFMAGCFWGFASKSTQHRYTPYILSILPALYMLSAYSVSGGYRVIILGIGFTLLLPIDFYFTKTGLAPTWWLRLRIPLTITVVFCLVMFQFRSFIGATLGIS